MMNGSSNNNNNGRTTTTFIIIMIPMYISYRMYIAQYMPIMDCDEIYNYWEPLHYMIYETGHQTWEYHYNYALRTYSYLVPFQIISQYIYQPMIVSLYTQTSNIHPKLQLFLLLRQTIAGFTACSELCFIYALIQYYTKNRQQQPKQYNDTSKEQPISESFVPYIVGIVLLSCTGLIPFSSSAAAVDDRLANGHFSACFLVTLDDLAKLVLE